MSKKGLVSDTESFLANEKNFYFNNQNLKRSGLKIQFTNEQIKEMAKCKKDMFYFIENYVYVQNTKYGMMLMKLYDYQRELLKLYRDHRYVIAMQGRQQGKCVVGDTKIKIRNKKTGQIVEMEIGKFHDMLGNK